MKNIVKLFILSFAGVFVLNSCGDEDFASEIPKGAMVYFSQGAGDDGFINILDLSAVNLDFTISMTDATGRDLEFAPVESIDVTVTYTDNSEGTNATAMLENLTAWPKSYQLNVQQLVDLFPESVVTVESLDLGDNFQVSADFHMQDGTKLSGWSPALIDKSPASIYSVLINYPVACASDLAGTYLAECINCPNGEVTSQAVQVIEITPGTYEINDISMGLFGPATPIVYQFSDVCGDIVLAPASKDFGTQVALEALEDSKVEQANGVITMDLKYLPVSCCGLPGLVVSYTLTPQ